MLSYFMLIMTNINFDEPSVGNVTANDEIALEVTNNGNGPNAVGVKGVTQDSSGVWGTSKKWIGVHGKSDTFVGVKGEGKSNGS